MRDLICIVKYYVRRKAAMCVIGRHMRKKVTLLSSTLTLRLIRAA